MRFIKGLKNEFETAVVNEPSVFEPLSSMFQLIVVIVSLFSQNRSGEKHFSQLTESVSRFITGIFSKKSLKKYLNLQLTVSNFWP